MNRFGFVTAPPMSFGNLMRSRTPENYLTASAKAASATPMTVLEYSSLLLSAGKSSDLNGSYQLDNTSGVWDPSLPKGNTTLAYADHASLTMYVVHAGYTGPSVSAPTTTLALPPDAVARLNTHIAAERSAIGLAPASLFDYVLVAVGLALIATAIILTLIGPAAITLPFFVMALKTLVVVGAVLAILGTVDAVLTPSPSNSICNPAGTSCCTTWSSALGGTATTCNNCTTNSGCSTYTGPPSGGLGSFGTDLLWIAGGLAAIIAVGAGGYIVYRYVSNRPRPGFGTTAPLRQRYPRAFERFTGPTPNPQPNQIPATP